MNKNNTYWINRQKQWIEQQNKDDAKLQKELEKNYRNTANELEKEIASYFMEYGQDDVIEFRMLMQNLPKKDKDLLFSDIDQFVKKFPEFEHLVPVRESVYKLNRLEGLHYSTQMKLLELGAIEQDMLFNHLDETYRKQFEYIVKELDLSLSINDQIIKDTILTKWINDENFSDRIWSNKNNLLNHLTTTYRDGLAKGVNYNKLANQVVDRFGVSLNDAKRLVWTESSFVLNQAHTQAYLDTGVEEYEINAIMDSKTSDICRAMDGKKFKFDDMKVGVSFPPFHPYCRSTFIGVLGGLLDDSPSNEIKTAEDARNALIEKGGFLEVEDSFLSINEELQISNIEQLLKLEEKFGAVHNSTSVTIVGNAKDRNSLAYVGTNITNPLQQNLSLSPLHYNDRKKHIEGLKREVEMNWAMPAKMVDETLEVYTVTHEYGHMLQNVLTGELMKERGWDPNKPFGMLDLTKKTPKAQRKFYTKVRADVEKISLKEIVDIAKESDPNLSLFDHISDYGKTSEAEFFAEVFANSQLGAPNALGKAMNIWLERKGLIKK